MIADAQHTILQQYNVNMGSLFAFVNIAKCYCVFLGATNFQAHLATAY